MTYLTPTLRRPRFLISWWPWRAMAYLATSIPIAGALSVCLFIVVAPLAAAVNSLWRYGRPIEQPLLLLFAFSCLCVLALAPIVSFGVAVIERGRLGLVDPRPLAPTRWRGLAARYTTAAAWRETGYAFLLSTFVPMAHGTLAVLVLLDFTLVASPWLVGEHGERIVVIWTTIDNVPQTIPYFILGVVVVPMLVYLASLVATLQAMVARWLLGGLTDGTQLHEVTRSRERLVNAYEAERRRIERDVHDGAQPRLTSLSLQLGLAKLDVPDDSPAARPLAIALDQAKSLMVMLRQLVHGIRPQSLTDLGLAGAVRELAGGSTLPIVVHADLRQPVPELVETTAYFVASECLSNVARHAGATRAEVRLSQAGDDLILEVEDDGRGGADPAGGTGLIGLADRVAAVNGRLLLASPAGGPTVVRVELPCRT